MPNSLDGFSLIELLIVMAIIGVISAVFVTNVLAARNKANDTAAIAYLRQCITSLESVRDGTTGKFIVTPTTCEDDRLGEAKLFLPASVKSSTVTFQSDESYIVSVTSSTGKVYLHDGYRMSQS